MPTPAQTQRRIEQLEGRADTLAERLAGVRKLVVDAHNDHRADNIAVIGYLEDITTTLDNHGTRHDEHTDALEQLRETQLEHGTKLDALSDQVGEILAYLKRGTA